jgi:formylglycine-generating enzyme required for sulfatase activity
MKGRLVMTNLKKKIRPLLMGLSLGLGALALVLSAPAAQAKPKSKTSKGSKKSGRGKSAKGAKTAAPLKMPPHPPLMTQGRRFRDCEDNDCPWLVEVPASHFRMGSPLDELGRSSDESPQHPVTISYRLAAMETEVTRAQFAAFAEDTHHETQGGCWVWNGTKVEQDPARDWRQPGFEQTDQDPVVCVSWEDAQAFARWLSKLTDQAYRLPSEAEWEYMARAGHRDNYGFEGDSATLLCDYANGGDRSIRERVPDWKIPTAECNDKHPYTAPTKSYKSNGAGLFDMHGNVWEWVQDCWHPDYRDAPADGSAWLHGCADERRIVRGGSWFDGPSFLRAASRNRAPATVRGQLVGFRLVRTLP